MKRVLWFLAILSDFEFKSTTALRIACALGSDESCLSYGWNYVNAWQVPQDLPKALEIFEKACARGGGKSCRSAGDMYNGWPEGRMTFDVRDENQKAFRERMKNRERAIYFYDAGCEEKDAQACDSLGTLYHESGDDMKAMAAWTRACKVDSFFGCRQIQRLADEGNPIARASIIPRPSRHPFAEWPLGLRIWIITFLVSMIVGIVAAVKRPASKPLSHRALVIISTLMSLVLIALVIYMRVNADNRLDRMFAYATAIPALLIVIATVLLATKGNNAASRVLFLIGGFLSIPPGLIPIMVAHELRGVTPAASAAAPAPA